MDSPQPRPSRPSVVARQEYAICRRRNSPSRPAGVGIRWRPKNVLDSCGPCAGSRHAAPSSVTAEPACTYTRRRHHDLHRTNLSPAPATRPRVALRGHVSRRARVGHRSARRARRGARPRDRSSAPRRARDRRVLLARGRRRGSAARVERACPRAVVLGRCAPRGRIDRRRRRRCARPDVAARRAGALRAGERLRSERNGALSGWEGTDLSFGVGRFMPEERASRAPRRACATTATRVRSCHEACRDAAVPACPTRRGRSARRRESGWRARSPPAGAGTSRARCTSRAACRDS